jgi:hypothetical protein
MTMNADDEGLGGTAAGPTAVRDDELSREAERIAVPTFDMVSAPVEGLVDPAADAMPDADEPDSGPPVSGRPDTGVGGASAPTDESAPATDAEFTDGDRS